MLSSSRPSSTTLASTSSRSIAFPFPATRPAKPAVKQTAVMNGPATCHHRGRCRAGTADAWVQPTPANLSAAFRVASSQVPASVGTLRPMARRKESRTCLRANSPGPSWSVPQPSRSRAVLTGSSAPHPRPAQPWPAPAPPPVTDPAGGGSNARSGPAAGGAAGTVASLSTPGFTLTTSAGQKVTVKEASSTTYQKQASPASASAITTGESVLVLGTTSNTTITATQVTVEPPATPTPRPRPR